MLQDPLIIFGILAVLAGLLFLYVAPAMATMCKYVSKAALRERLLSAIANREGFNEHAVAH